ncbi:MAG: hypothetical protein ACP5JU_03190 [Minisyncoccia bacterium]
MKIPISDVPENLKKLLLIINNFKEPFFHKKLFYQKIVFLLSRMFPEYFDDIVDTFEPHHYGPYSDSLMEMADEMKTYGIIDDDGKLKDEYKKSLNLLLKEDSELAKLNEKIAEMKEALNDLSEGDLIYLVYNLYPEFTEKSKIKENVDSDKLETYVINLKDLSTKPKDDIKETIFKSLNNIPAQDFGKNSKKELIVKSDKGNQISVTIEGDKVIINHKEETK